MPGYESEDRGDGGGGEWLVEEEEGEFGCLGAEQGNDVVEERESVWGVGDGGFGIWGEGELMGECTEERGKGIEERSKRGWGGAGRRHCCVEVVGKCLAFSTLSKLEVQLRAPSLSSLSWFMSWHSEIGHLGTPDHLQVHII